MTPFAPTVALKAQAVTITSAPATLTLAADGMAKTASSVTEHNNPPQTQQKIATASLLLTAKKIQTFDGSAQQHAACAFHAVVRTTRQNVAPLLYH